MSPKPARQRPGSTSALGRPTLTPNVEPLHVGDRAPESGSPAVPESQTHGVTDSGSAGVRQSQTSAVPEQQTAEKPESGTPAVRQSQTPAATDHRTPAVTDSGSPADAPRYLTLVRKEARLHADQVVDLGQLRRRLNRARTDRTEPLTDNTLIRVAVDMLLAREADLKGNTESELRRSVLPLE